MPKVNKYKLSFFIKIQTNRKNLSQIFDDGNSIYKDFYSKNHIIRLDNARRDLDEKEKRLQWNDKKKQPTTTKHMRSTSMDLMSSNAYLKGKDTTSALNNLKKNLRDELSSMNMVNDTEEDIDDFQ